MHGELAEADVADRPAKDKLRGKLKAAINDVLRSKGVTGDVEDVFFTSLVVQ
ncbi:MAG: flagellar basal body-associated FliL family protein [Polymorphobacter sp.]